MADLDETLAARVQALEEALRPFAAVVAYVGPGMADQREIMIAFARKDEPPASSPSWDTADVMPTVATAGDVRRAARLLGLPERT